MLQTQSPLKLLATNTSPGCSVTSPTRNLQASTTSTNSPYEKAPSTLKCSVNDKSDRKSLDELVRNLLVAKENYFLRHRSTKPKSEPQSSRLKRNNHKSPKKLENKEKKPNDTRKLTISKKKPKDTEYPKLTTLNKWLVKRDDLNKTDRVANLPKKPKKVNARKPKSGNVMDKTDKKRNKASVSESFEKYGILMPTFEEIVAQHKKYLIYKERVDDLDAICIPKEPLKLDIQENEEPAPVMLDCKHLTVMELRRCFKRNEQYIDDIFHGIQYSERHRRFQEEKIQDQFTTKDLKYNTSTIIFTYEQKRLLLSYLHTKFHTDKNSRESNQYYFKVLLPELCTKLFMDTYNMKYQEAVDYLENRPVE